MYGGGNSRPGGGYGQGGGYGSSTKKVKALYDYYGENPADLSFQKGDIITITSETARSGPEWWQGEFRGKRGSFPVNHVEVLQDAVRSGNDIPLVPMSYAPSSPPSYNPPSSYSPPSSSYTPPSSSYTPPSNNFDSSSSLPSSGKPAKVKSFSGGGDNVRKALAGMIMAAIILVLATIALVFPWYYVNINGAPYVYQWSGAQQLALGTNGTFMFTAITTNLNVFRPWSANLWYHIRTAFVVSLIFLIAAWISTAAYIYPMNILRRGDDFDSKKIFIMCAISFLMFFLSGFCFFQIRTAYGKDVNSNPTQGPLLSFAGSINNNQVYGSWGPAFGWIIEMVTMGISLLQLINAFLMVRADGGFFG